MQMRRLGRSDLEIAPLVFGGNVLGWTADEKMSFALLDAFVDAGFNMIDTADVYARWIPTGVGTSERVLGAWLRHSQKRHRVLLATKVGLPMADNLKGLSQAYIVEAVEASLRRLQTDYIDLYQAHMDDPATPLEETMEAFGKLIAQGKVRVVGASNYSYDRLKAALEAKTPSGARYQTLQPPYNLADRSAFEGPLRDLCLQQELGVLPYFGLASGFLTGKYRRLDDLPAGMRGDLVRKYMDGRGMRLLEALDGVAEARSSKPAQIALAWLQMQPGVTAPIASATSLVQLAEIMGAARLTLTADDLSVLDLASARPATAET
jgi:aryl-alcohol dehydrogenase-like predicted oxidoreductase